jgi:hypothetical protein
LIGKTGDGSKVRLNEVKLYNSSDIATLEWPESESAAYKKRYLLPLVMEGASSYIANASCDVRVITVGDLALSVTICDMNYSDTYTCSTYTHYVSYAIDELWELNNSLLEMLGEKALRLLGGVTKRLKINKCVFVNNWLISTNLYGKITESRFLELTAFLTRTYPDHAIVFRSLNGELCSPHMNALSKLGYRHVFARQVYLLNAENIKGHAAKITRKDRTLLAESGFELLNNAKLLPDDAARILELYNMLYLEKYSAHNPAFTVDFIRRAIDEHLLEVRALRSGDSIVAVLGYFVLDGTMTAPLFGYDTSLPKKTGLYRMLTVLLLDESLEKGLCLHRSSGAAEFKRCRGARAEAEYSAVYTKHLGIGRKLGWRLIELVANKIALPLIRRYKL